MTKSNKAFYFAYGNGGYGDVKAIKEAEVTIENKYEGIGVAFRAGIDFIYRDEKSIYMNITATEKMTLKLEFKTELSGNTAEDNYLFKLEAGENYLNFDIPELYSQLKEICIVSLRNQRTGYETAKTKFKITSFEII